MLKRFLDFFNKKAVKEPLEVGAKWKVTKISENPPEEGLAIQAKVSRIIDGDTVEVTLEIPFRIRLLGVDVAERNTELGKEAIQFAGQFLGKEVMVYVPLNTANLLDATQLGRVLGQVWVDGKNLSDVMKSYSKEKGPK